MDLHTQPPADPGVRWTALAQLVRAVWQLEGLTAQVGPFALYPDAADRAPKLVGAVCRALDVPLTFDLPINGRGRDFAVAALGAQLQRTLRVSELAGMDPAEAAAGARRIYEQGTADLRWHAVRRPDGSVIRAVAAGPPHAPSVVLSTPCGMGYLLSLPWLTALRSDYRCVIVEARGTAEPIGDPEDFDQRGYDVGRQVGDLLAVIEELGIAAVHLMGLCAGAAVALAAAAQRPDLVESLSLWHADLDLGGEAEKTDHQVNMRAMLDLAGESRDCATWVRGKLTSGPMPGVPDGVGPLVVRPYATAELYYRYAKLTGATMHWDSRRTAVRVAQRCLIVTSADDTVAHPAGSRLLAGIMPGARLVMANHGSHLDAFRATDGQVDCLRAFLRS